MTPDFDITTKGEQSIFVQFMLNTESKSYAKQISNQLHLHRTNQDKDRDENVNATDDKRQDANNAAQLIWRSKAQ